MIFSNAAAGVDHHGLMLRENATEHVLYLGNTPLQIVNETTANNKGTGAGVFLSSATPSVIITSARHHQQRQGIWT